MKKTLFLILIGLTLPFFAWGRSETSPSQPLFWGETTCAAGAAVTLWLSPGSSLESVEVALYPQKSDSPAEGDAPLPWKRVAWSRLFRWEGVPARPLLLGVLGVPPTAEPGKYWLVLTGVRRGEPWRLVRPFEVTERSWAYQLLRLNQKMTTIMRTPDPRKAEEARILWEILGHTDPQAFYHWGPFIKPLDSDRITTTFGDRREYLYPDGVRSETRHTGIDYAAPEGTPLAACGAGKVVLATDRVVTGNTVLIEHLPGVYSVHYHLHVITVKEGDFLQPGDIIGTVGTTGFSTGNHLHWELRIFGSPVDPELFLGRPLIDKKLILNKMGATEPRGR